MSVVCVCVRVLNISVVYIFTCTGPHTVLYPIVSSASFNDSDSSSEASDDLMSGPDAVAKMTNTGVSGSFSMDYYRYMESKKNHHSFGGQ